MDQNTISSNEPYQRTYLFAHPQTASNLLTKILNLEQQDVLPQTSNHTTPSSIQSGNIFKSPSWKVRSLQLYTSPISSWTDAQISDLSDCYQDSLSFFQHWLAKSEASGTKVFVKEHVICLTEPHHQAQFLAEKKKKQLRESCIDPEIHRPSYDSFWMSLDKSPLNKTILTDEFLLSFQPTFLVRHPALVFPAYFKAHVDMFGYPGNEQETRELEIQFDGRMTFHWLRCLYDFYTTANSITTEPPVILDGDDVITKPDVVTRYAELVGFDPTKLRWE